MTTPSMKTLRIGILAGIAALAASAAIAGPGFEYWNARRNPVKEQAPVASAAATITPVKCEAMPETIGKVTKMVECSGAVAGTAACKAHCGGM